MARDKIEAFLEGGARRGGQSAPSAPTGIWASPQEAGKQQLGGKDSGHLGELPLSGPAGHRSTMQGSVLEYIRTK